MRTKAKYWNKSRKLCGGSSKQMCFFMLDKHTQEQAHKVPLHLLITLFTEWIWVYLRCIFLKITALSAKLIFVAAVLSSLVFCFIEQD